jgi:FkbM family methyltransferase
MPSKLSLVAGKVRDNLMLDAALLRTPTLPPGQRVALAARKYAAIAADKRSIPYLGHQLHYDNRLTPALLPSYLQDAERLEGLIDFAQARTVLDIGANIGQFGATLAWRHPHLRIWSFEPNPEARELLERNVAQTPDWTVVPYGVGASDAEIDFFYVPGKSAQGSAVRDNATAGLLQTQARQVRVPVRRVDAAFIAELGLPEVVDLLKVDVEGAEEDVLRGLTDVRWKHMTLETSLEREGLQLEAALDILEEVGGARPDVLWAGDPVPGAIAREVVLRAPAAAA